MIQNQPNDPVKFSTRTFWLADPIDKMFFIKGKVTFLEEHLTIEEKSDKLIAAKLEALKQKISNLENMIMQISDACDKGEQEVLSLLKSFEPVEHE